MKLCKDCKWCTTLRFCQRMGTYEDPVTGRQASVELLNCHDEREGQRHTRGMWEDTLALFNGRYFYPDPSKCGPDAQYFEPKEQP